MRKSLLLIICCIAIRMQSQQWMVSYPVDEGVALVGGDCNEEGNFIIGAWNKAGGSGYLDAYAMYVNNDGAYVEKRFSFEGYKSHLCSAMCLDDGNAFVVGVKGGTLTNRVYDTLWIMVIDANLDIVEEHSYPIVEPYKTWTTDVYLEFNNYGEVIILADVSERDYPLMTIGVYALFKCDTHGNVLKSKYLKDGHGMNGARPTGIIKVPDSDKLMLLGKGFFVTNCHSICYIDNDLEIVDVYPLPWLEDMWNYTDCWKNNGHFLMSSVTHYYGMTNNSYYAAVFEVDEQGCYIDTLVYDRADTSDYTAQFGSMAYVDDETIYIATYWENGLNEQQSDAVICLIDNNLNLKGTKRLKQDNVKIRIMHCCKTSDGGCLVYGQCIKTNGDELLCVWKLMPDDFIITWTLTENSTDKAQPEVYPNPTNDNLNIPLMYNGGKSVVVDIVDVNGRKFFEREFISCESLLTLEVSSLDDGIYYYEVFADRQCVRKGKFIKR